MKAVRTLSVLGLAGLFLAAAMPAMAVPTVYNLTDDNSSISVDLDGGTGINAWTVDAITHLETQWFWYRTGAMTDEASISTLTLTANKGATDTNFDTKDDTAYVKYTDAVAGFTVELRTSLDGGAAGDGSSTLAEQVTIKNTGAANLTFHFFQYTDFNLGGTPNDDTIQIDGSLPDSIFQWDSKNRGDTVVVPQANFYEAGDATTLLNKFITSDGSTTLSNVAAAGPGDVAWALQWDRIIQPGKTFQIVIGKEITPEPATMAILVLGGAGLFLAKRRRG
jgi:hypothetical protein